MNKKTAFKSGAAQALVLLALGLSTLTASAAELKTLAWGANAKQTVLKVTVDGKTDYTTRTLEHGLRLRVTLKSATLAPDVPDIGGHGLAKGVFPYLGDDGKSVHIDLLMRKPGKLQVKKTDYGLKVVADAAAATPPPASEQPTAATTAAPVEEANTVEGVKFTTLAGGRVQIDVKMKHKPQEPSTFSISTPPRVALDFYDTTSAIGSKTFTVNQGAVNSVSAVQAGNRTRIVLNLLAPVDYEKRITPNGMTIVVAGPSAAATASTGTPKATTFGPAKNEAKYAITKVDFRRGDQGAGKVIVDLSDPSVASNVTEQAGEIDVNFTNTKIPDKLERRLDVVDFATPVQSIDTYREGDNTRIVIHATGKYQQTAYQTGKIFTVNVRPLTKEEVAKQKAQGSQYKGQKLSLNFQDIPVRAALQVIADFTNLNFVTSDSVRGNVTLRLKDVPWDQALDVILRAKGLAERRSGNIVWVGTAKEIAAKEKEQLEAEKSVANLEPLESELIPINYAKAEDIAALLKSIKAVDTGIKANSFASVSVSKIETESNSLLSSRGQVTVDKRTNSILIQDIPSKVKQVRALIAKLDRPVRQVMIETRIVEADDSFSRSLGARFGVTNRNQNFKIPGSSNTNAGDAILTGKLENADNIYTNNPTTYPSTGDALNVNLPATATNAASIAFTLFKVGSTQLLSMELSALEADGKGKIVASPRLVTANQKEAYIEQGQEVYKTTGGLNSTSQEDKAVLSLKVTPQITPDNSVILDVYITNDSFAPATSTSNSYTAKNTKRLNTQVLLNNGETVVIGGIYQENKSTDVNKVPLLGDLPVVGAFFRQKDVSDKKTELLIFLTPRILTPSLKLTGS